MPIGTRPDSVSFLPSHGTEPFTTPPGGTFTTPPSMRRTAVPRVSNTTTCTASGPDRSSPIVYCSPTVFGPSPRLASVRDQNTAEGNVARAVGGATSTLTVSDWIGSRLAAPETSTACHRTTDTPP